MAWTKTANIKGEQGRAGIRSTEIFFNNSSSELDGDLKIASDGTLYVCKSNLYPRVTGLPKTLGANPGDYGHGNDTGHVPFQRLHHDRGRLVE